MTAEQTCSNTLAGLQVHALDAAMPFDFEAKAKRVMEQKRILRIGIVGFGTFGQFMAKRLVEAGHQVCWFKAIAHLTLLRSRHARPVRQMLTSHAPRKAAKSASADTGQLCITGQTLLPGPVSDKRLTKTG